ncbi:BadF/BadG/BcrA/BcrD ATPase family protein [Rubrivirga sp. S365]|uniref:BadF/BadG/BcrA/BcrD ATPase family protein n=1 Tax=Rubrivirga litoralis TaxID=3075598 RepID=A0ABU3BUC2_9BACT|nr:MULTISPECIES: BadF/BadG/BcrA/BcrD ATPase family protein [unclassified Rubrivirga]MDT0632891.1 BadF/BadG/BcrA/BcrD ATPase family protein [Rubrivirga sp. F394]MDT7857796.1 BadF/BadG/BcrA/BcrD ATPase family protein [Rubrivirga sp. S365]
MPPAPLYIGLDAGGTKTAALAAAGGEPQRFDGPGAQLLRDGVEATASTLVALVEEARRAFRGAPLGGVAVGLAGAGRIGAQEAVAAALRPRLDGAAVAVTHDGDVAYRAAWGDESGLLALVGTGSFLAARTEAGETLRAGGWGALLGDDGGGAALGRAALRAVLAALDGGPPTALVDRAAADGLGTLDDVVGAIYVDKRPLASFAGLLLAAAEGGDWTAEALLARETNALAQQAGWLATRAGDSVAQRVAMSGGLAREAVYRASLESALGRHLPGWTVSHADVAPAEGALQLARTLAP